MINHISIKNFATIENTEVDFEKGLNIITGETGAGKSIVIEAISLALGARADTSLIRTGQERATVQLLGEINNEEVVITRELSSNGKNICKLNGEIVTLSSLNEISNKLADIHGQYDNQSLLNPDNHINFVDCYRREDVEPLKEQVSEKYREFSHAKSELSNLLRLEKENARKKDFYSFEINEIDKANLVIGEDIELEERVSILQNSEKIFESINVSNEMLSDGSPSVLDYLSQVSNYLNSVSGYGKDFQELSEELNDVYYRLQDISHELRNKKESLTFSPTELDDSISRLNTIENLKKKYGNDISEILEYRDKIQKDLSIIDNFDDEKKKLEVNLINSRNELLKSCELLSSLRKQIIEEIKPKLIKELLDLNFQNAEIDIKIEKLEHPEENGFDKIEIYISLNKGEALKPLSKVASGGEMSRIMLAFKNIISSYDMIPTLIFDEIDSGISGITASVVSGKLKEISKEHQVLCITHLPQIASKGDFNYRIVKNSDENKTYTTIEKLSEDGKINEIARLLGGTNITETTIKSAKELIES